MKGRIAAAIVSLTLSSVAHAEIHLNVQHAGYAGHAALGLGYKGSIFGADALYGWTPSRLAGHDVRSLTLKGLCYPFAVGREGGMNVRPFFGLGAFYSPDDELFVRLPKQYPAGYYVPSAIRPALLTGLRLQIKPGLDLSLEYALLDSELAYVKDKGGVAYDQVGSVGFGVHYRFQAE